MREREAEYNTGYFRATDNWYVPVPVMPRPRPHNTTIQIGCHMEVLEAEARLCHGLSTRKPSLDSGTLVRPHRPPADGSLVW